MPSITKEGMTIEVAKNFVITILQSNINNDSLHELVAIQTGNNEVLLEHLKTINEIISDAIEIMEGD